MKDHISTWRRGCITHGLRDIRDLNQHPSEETAWVIC